MVFAALNDPVDALTAKLKVCWRAQYARSTHHLFSPPMRAAGLRWCWLPSHPVTAVPGCPCRMCTACALDLSCHCARGRARAGGRGWRHRSLGPQAEGAASGVPRPRVLLRAQRQGLGRQWQWRWRWRCCWDGPVPLRIHQDDVPCGVDRRQSQGSGGGSVCTPGSVGAPRKPAGPRLRSVPGCCRCCCASMGADTFACMQNAPPGTWPRFECCTALCCFVCL